MTAFPKEVISTARGYTYWEVAPKTYQVTKGEAPKGTAGYASLPAIMGLKGEPWSTKAPYIQSERDAARY